MLPWPDFSFEPEMDSVAWRLYFANPTKVLFYCVSSHFKLLQFTDANWKIGASAEVVMELFVAILSY